MKKILMILTLTISLFGICNAEWRNRDEVITDLMYNGDDQDLKLKKINAYGELGYRTDKTTPGIHLVGLTECLDILNLRINQNEVDMCLDIIRESDSIYGQKVSIQFLDEDEYLLHEYYIGCIAPGFTGTLMGKQNMGSSGYIKKIKYFKIAYRTYQ